MKRSANIWKSLNSKTKTIVNKLNIVHLIVKNSIQKSSVNHIFEERITIKIVSKKG